MLDRTEIIYIQYEIAMAIGSSLDLNKMLRKSIASILRVLNCPAGGILMKDQINNITVNLYPVFSIPTNAHKYSEIKKAINLIPDTYNTQQYNSFTQKLPTKLNVNSKEYIHFLDISNFGILFLYTKDDHLDNDIIRILIPLMDKLSISAQACIQNEELIKHREHLEELVAEQTHAIISQKKSLEIANEELKELNSTKNKFFSIIAHDLKSPFNGIIGLTNILANNFDKYSKEQIIEFISEINNNSKNTYKLLENLLDWSQIQTGRIKFNPTKIDIKEITVNNIELLKNNATEKNITLYSEIKDAIYITADKLMLNTIMRNLISNAIKFTPQGGKVYINSEANKYHVKVSIIDSGIGFTNEQIGKIFKIDESFSTLGTELEKGSGLGLILCKEFINKHNGNIEIKNNANIGSCISFTIPWQL